MDDKESCRDWEGFEWDEGNLSKNWEKHRVSGSECEEIFFNRPLVAAPNKKHSETEARFFALGITDAGWYLFVVFAVHRKKIRAISARNMNYKERKVFEQS